MSDLVGDAVKDAPFDWKELDATFKEHNETFVMRTEVWWDMQDQGLSYRLLLTDKSIYRLLPDGTKPHKRIPLLTVHSIMSNDEDPSCLEICRKHTSAKSKLEAIGASLGKKVDLNALLERNPFRATSEANKDLFIACAEGLVRDAWQRAVETSFLPSDEMYQFHTPVLKLNRKLKAQDRVVVLSDKWLYNVEPSWGSDQTVNSKSLKWAAPISSIRVIRLTRRVGDLTTGASVSVYLDQQQVKKALTDSPKHVGSKGNTVNDYHTFCFRTIAERHRFVCEVARIFHQVSNPISNAENVDPSTFKRLVVDDSRDREDAAAESVDGSGGLAARVMEEGYLVKFTGGGKGSHKKYIVLYDDGKVEWRDQQTSKGKFANIVIVSAGVGELPKKKNFSEEEKARLFTIQTDVKTLQLLADSNEDRDRWVRSLQRYRASMAV